MHLEPASLVRQLCRIQTRLHLYPDAYSRKLDVLNRGLSGYNTDWAIPVLEQVG
jgi:hypothetical protein